MPSRSSSPTAAYVAFALAHPGRFRLMFRSEWIDRDDAALRAAGGAAYGRLQRHIAAVEAAAGADAPGRTRKPRSPGRSCTGWPAWRSTASSAARMPRTARRRPQT